MDRQVLTGDLVTRADLKLDCLPVPWIGDPRRADVLLLGLNPGWTPATEELERGIYADENRLGLTFESRVAMWNLDGRLEGTPGHRWWSQRLRLLIERVGLSRVQSRVACVEWFPYHSPAFRRLPLIVASQAHSFRLVESAVARDAVILIMRSKRLWLEAVPKLADAPAIELNVPRSAYITPRNLAPGAFERICAALGTAPDTPD